jgi:hypothetical protein
MFWGIWDAEKENLVLPAGKKKDALTLAFHPKAQVKKYTQAGLLACFYAPSRPASAGQWFFCEGSTD